MANWSFLQAGVIDELSLFLAPVSDGGVGGASIFTKIPSLNEGRPVEFLLKDMEKIGGGHIVKNHKGDGKMNNQTYVKLNNGVEMPMADIGTFMLSPDEAESSVVSALQAGYRLIDTANAYVNEEEVGNAVKKCGIPREELFLTAKVWISNGGYDKAKASLHESMRKLQTEYIA